MRENIVVVDGNDLDIGGCEKIEVHEKGLLHRAFSIFIYNSKNQMLLQRREKGKYHSGGLWTNTCCSHQRINEELENCIHKRLDEEMGIDCNLEEIFVFKYFVKFQNGLIENEIDHVFIGKYEENPIPNKYEVEDWQWVDFEKLLGNIEVNPDLYTEWFKISVEKVIKYIKDN